MAARKIICYISLSICFLLFSFVIGHVESHLYSRQIHENSGSQWYWMQPKPSGNLLYSVNFANRLTGYAAGSVGTILKTTDGGTSWMSQYSNTSLDLSKIFCLNASLCFAAGNSGTILKTTNGGNSWTVNSTEKSTYFYDISFTDKSTGYAAGLGGTILKTTDGGSKWNRLFSGTANALFCVSFLNQSTGVAAGFNTLLKTTNKGKSWVQQNINIPPSSSIVGISFIDSNTIFAAGNSPGGAFYKTTNNGINWQAIPLGLTYLFGGSVDLVRGMSFMNKSTGFIVTDFGTVLKTINSGKSWQKDSSFRPSVEKLAVMRSVNVLDSEYINICGGGGTVIRSTNAGHSWYAATGNKKSIRANCFVNSKIGFCVGEDGSISKTPDGGMDWYAQGTFTNRFLNSIFFVNELTGYIAGDSGLIYKTTDTGISWNSQVGYRGFNGRSIYFVTKDTGIVAGGNQDNERAFIFKTTNGGNSWLKVFDSLSLGLLNSIGFINNNTGFITGNNGNLLKTTNAGDTWVTNNIHVENLNSISFADSLNGIIVGTNGLTFNTTTGGDDWTSHASGTFVKLNSVSFTDNGYAIAAGEYGTIISSTNGGTSWNSVQKITSNNFYSVNIIDYKSLFVFGEYGTILYTLNKEMAFNSAKKNIFKENFNLIQNFPNPFNASTRIQYELNPIGNLNHVKVRINVSDLLGKQLCTLVDDIENAGIHEIEFNAANFPSGIYFYTLFINEERAGIRKMILLK